jgi:Kef-type K+ transport system membrane component KefB
MSSESQGDSEGLGWRFWLGLMGVTLAVGVGLILALFLFGAAWYQWGFIGAAILLIAVAMGVKSLQDRRARRQWS